MLFDIFPKMAAACTNSIYDTIGYVTYIKRRCCSDPKMSLICSKIQYRYHKQFEEKEEEIH